MARNPNYHATKSFMKFSVIDTECKRLRRYADTLRALLNTAFMLHARNKHEEALEIYIEVYNIKAKKLGDNDPSTLISQYNMASGFKELGKLQEAIKNFRDVFEKRKITIGLHHRDTLDTWQELESVLAKQLKCENEIEIYEHLNKGHAAGFGVDNEDAMLMLEKTADRYQVQHKYDEAYCRYNKLYELMKETTDPNIFNIQHKIGLSLQLQGKDKGALETFEDVYKKKFSVFGGYHTETLSVKYDIGEVLLAQGDLSRALETFADIYRNRFEIFGINDPRTLYALERKAFVLTRQRQYDQALNIYEHAYNKRISIHGREHKYTLITGTNMANVLARQGCYRMAREISTAVLKIQIKNKDPNRLVTWCLMADMLRKQRKYEEALNLYELLISKLTKLFGHDHGYTIRTRTNLAAVLISLHRLDDALQVVEITLAKIKNKLGPEHKQTLLAELQVASVLRLLGKHEEALNIYEKIEHI